MKNLLSIFICFLFFHSNVFSQQIEKLKISEKEIPQGYTVSKKLECKSIQTTTFYKEPEIYEMLIGKIKNKDIQNFTSPKDNGSIMYFEFEEEFKGEDFLKGLLWGESMKPTSKHPEEIFVKKNILIIWSFDKKSELKKASKAKIQLELK